METKYIKYPRTFHLPWSLGVQSDDKVIKRTDHFVGRRVVVTAKMDGENTTMYRDHVHARSIDSQNHVSRNWVKAFWANIRNDIPDGWRICGENLFAKHSIFYRDLPSYFMGFSIWTEKNEALSWDATQEWFDLLGIHSVPVLYDGVYDEAVIKALWSPSVSDELEGYVVRLADGFAYDDFKVSAAKFVRPGHVQTNKHWKDQPVVPNTLIGS